VCSSDLCEMKPVQILLLVAAGALSGVVITKVWQTPKRSSAAPVSTQVRETPAEALPQYTAPPQAAEPAPVAVEKAAPVVDKPSPVVERRERPQPNRRSRNARRQRAMP